MSIATLTIDFVAKLATLQTSFDRAAQIAERNSKRIEGSFAGIKSALGALGIGASVAGLVHGFDALIKKLDDLDERAQSLGVNPEFLSALDLTGKAAGVADIDKALVKFTATLADARAGSKQAENVVRALGISVSGLRDGTVDVESALRSAAEAVAKYADGFEKGNLVQEAFGAKNQKLIALLNKGAEGLTEFGGASREAVAEAARLAAEIDKLSASWERWKLALGGTVARGINTLFGAEDTIGQQVDRLQSRIDGLVAQRDEIAANRGKPPLLQSLLGLPAANADLEFADRQISEITARIAALSKQREGLIDLLPPPEPEKPRAPDTRVAQDSGGDSFLDSLRRRVAAQEQSEFAALRLEAVQKRVSSAAEPYIAALQRAKDLQESIALFARDVERAERDAEAEDAFDRQLGKRVAAIKAESEAIGLSAAAQAKLNAEREIAAQLDQRLRALGDDQNSIRRAFEAAERAREEANRAIDELVVRAQFAALDDLLAEIEQETRLIRAGNAERQRMILLRELDAKGIDKSSDAYRNAIKKINEATDAIIKKDEMERVKAILDDFTSSVTSTVEDAIVNFRSLRSVVESVLNDIARAFARLVLEKPIQDFMATLFGRELAGGSGAGAGGLMGLLSLFFRQSQVGVFAAGTDYVPRTGLALVHKGEKIIPAARNKAQTSVSLVQYNTFSGGVSRAELAPLLEQNRRMTLAELNDLTARNSSRIAR